MACHFSLRSCVKFTKFVLVIAVPPPKSKKNVNTTMKMQINKVKSKNKIIVEEGTKEWGRGGVGGWSKSFSATEYPRDRVNHLRNLT